MNSEHPLVSILIPNYNYGRYLPYCLESILRQTYDNYEVIFRDNNSTDDSYETALKYKKLFNEKGIYCSVIKNKRNVGSNQNSALCAREDHGDFRYYLASDDAIKPDFLERCVDVFVKHPSVGMVITHREEIDDEGNITSLPPFYNRDCVVPSESQASVFMMAGIAIPGQRMLRRGELLDYREMNKNFQVAGDWFTNFLNACEADVAYIKDPLCQYRVHNGNETNESEKNLMGIMEHYQLITYFTGIARELKMSKVFERHDSAIEKLGSMCLRYAMKMIQDNLFRTARQYLYLAPVFSPEITKNTQYRDLKKYLSETEEYMIKHKAGILDNSVLQRGRSYDPPEDAIPV